MKHIKTILDMITSNDRIDLQIVVAIVILILSVGIGYVVEKLVVSQLARIARKTPWKFDDFLIASLKGIVPLLFLMPGSYIVIHYLQVSPKILVGFERAISATGIFLVTIMVSRFVALSVKNINHNDKAVQSLSLLSHLSQSIVYIIGILIILQSLGVSITPMLTALGVGGLAVALALQDTLSNLFSGIHIVLSRQVKPGDYVKLESGLEGYVSDITWRNTVIRSLPNNLHIIPNAKFAQASITNYNLPDHELSVSVPVGVSYASNLEHVEKVVIETARETMEQVEGGVPHFSPLIRFTDFGESSIKFNAIMRARTFVDQYIIISEFIRRLHKRFSEEGIEIPFPIRTVHIKEVTLPKQLNEKAVELK